MSKVAGSVVPSIALIGFTSIIGQVVLLRELLVVFYGNELSVAAMLAAWLLWVATGSSLFPRLIGVLSRESGPACGPGTADAPNGTRAAGHPGPFSALQAAVALVLPLEILFVRNVRSLAGALPGEVFGFFPTLVWSFVALAPLCILLGWLFTAACQMAADRLSVGQVYLYESMGSVAGGLLSSFVLLYHFDPWQIILGLSALNLASAWGVWKVARGRERELRGSRGRLARLWPLPIALAAILLIPPAAAFLQDLSLRQRWRGYELVESRDSIYGNLAVTVRGSQHSFFENGLLLSTTEDFLAAEEGAHYVLLEHPKPRRVLLIGGGTSGLLREVLKHPVESVDYVELDPTLIETAKRFLPAPDRLALRDPRVAMHFLDGRLYVQGQATQNPHYYDVALLAVPHPFTAQVNRLYTLEFLQAVRQVLQGDGVFSMGIISAENYPSQEMQRLDACVYRTVKEVFAEVLALPGDHALVLASPRSGVLTADVSTLLARWQERRIETALLTPSHLRLRLSPERLEYARRTFGGPALLNHDFEPIGLYYDLVLWSGQYSAGLRDILRGALAFHSVWLLLVLATVSLALMTGITPPGAAVPLGLAVLGGAGMAWEVVLVFAFQVLHGYVYHQIALVVTAFMVGLTAGSWWATRVRAEEAGANRRRLALILGVAAAYSLLLPPAFSFLAAGPAGSYGFVSAQVVFPGLTIIAGGLVGAAFPLASALYVGQGTRASRAAGILYAADLVGASLGALATGALLIPVLGLAQTALTVALISGFGSVVLLTRRWGD
ncbi:MAG: hypothetical protein AB1566_05405 [Chloroflexota bacterium]